MMYQLTLKERGTPEYQKFIPVVTIAFGLICIGLFAGFNLDGGETDWSKFRRWGAPSIIDLWNGDYWGLISTNFLHAEVWHVAFNLYWFWMFGKKIEFESARWVLPVLVVSAAAFASVTELVTTSNTGIGLSGVVYALFGYLLVKSRYQEEYRHFLNRNDIFWMIAWLFFCIVLTYTGALNVGNGAHFGGFVWGMLIAWLSRFRKPALMAVPGLIFAALLPFAFWQPWSVVWLSEKAYQLHKQEHTLEAEEYYLKILEKDPGNAFATENLKAIQAYNVYLRATGK